MGVRGRKILWSIPFYFYALYTVRLYSSFSFNTNGILVNQLYISPEPSTDWKSLGNYQNSHIKVLVCQFYFSSRNMPLLSLTHLIKNEKRFMGIVSRKITILEPTEFHNLFKFGLFGLNMPESNISTKNV